MMLKRLAVGGSVLLFALAAYGGSQPNVDINDYDNGFRIDGIFEGSEAFGFSVSGAGDVNGDGLADVIVGDPEDFNGSFSGTAFVIFGKADSNTIEVRDLEANNAGFRIIGIASGDETGWSVAGAGDVNGDGRDDLIVGARGSDFAGRQDAGQSFVVFGKSDTQTVDLASTSLNNDAPGFYIGGAQAGDLLGTQVSGAGDVNGDGLHDVIVGAPLADASFQSQNTGRAYVIFGKSDTAGIDVATLGDAGFRIDGAAIDDLAGNSVSGAGDFNGDGLADVIVGARLADPDGDADAGEAYVVFGKTNVASIDLGSLGNAGVRIKGISPGDDLGRAVSGAGDVNGDGLADVVIGAPGADPDTGPGAGETYLVTGQTDSGTIDLAVRGSGGGFRILGAAGGDFSGFRVGGAGDMDGDGLADIVIGVADAFATTPDSYVVYGKRDVFDPILGALVNDGFSIRRTGSSDVSGGGDINGDGLADLVLGAANTFFDGTANTVFSTSTPLLQSVYRARAANGDAPPVAVGVSGNGSNASHPDARFWIDFADGATAFEIASDLTVTLRRTSGTFAAPGAAVSWIFATDRTTWTSAEVQLRYLASELVVTNELALQVVFSADGNAPFIPLASVVNPSNNTISAQIDQTGYLFLGQQALPDVIFGDGFESS